MTGNELQLHNDCITVSKMFYSDAFCHQAKMNIVQPIGFKGSSVALKEHHICEA